MTSNISQCWNYDECFVSSVRHVGPAPTLVTRLPGGNFGWTAFHENWHSGDPHRDPGRDPCSKQACLGRARAAPCGPSLLRQPHRFRGECPRTTLKLSRTFCRPRHSRPDVRACCRRDVAVLQPRVMGAPAGAARHRTEHGQTGLPILPQSSWRHRFVPRPSRGGLLRMKRQPRPGPPGAAGSPQP